MPSKSYQWFIIRTSALTDQGERPIEQIQIGDKVLAKDEATGETDFKEVEWLYEREVDTTYNIIIGDETITTTDEHPFWVVGEGWVQAKDLRADDILKTNDGEHIAIDRIEVKQEHATVYNFKVKDYHTYFVSGLGIYTHNACSKKKKQTGSYTITFESGKQYHGKGPRSRANQSARKISKDYKDKPKKTDWTPSKNDREAFIAEYRRLDKGGGPKSPRNYNKRQSPGEKYLKQDKRKKRK